MQILSNEQRYGIIAVWIHWGTAAALVIVLLSGFWAAGLVDAPEKIFFLRVHIIFAIAAFFLTLFRLFWWLFIDCKPGFQRIGPKWQLKLAKIVHTLFYIIVFGMTASGLGMLILSHSWEILFANAAVPLPDFLRFRPRIPHGIGARVLSALVVLHITAAFYHQYILRDRMISRIRLGYRSKS